MSYSNSCFESAKFRRIELSRHARKRAKQRGINPEAADLIKAYGEASHDGDGGIRYLMTDRAMLVLSRIVGHTQQIERLKGCYIVVAAENQDQVITIAHRH